MKEKVLVSSCLQGIECRYNASAYHNDKVDEYVKDKDVILVCPEVLGGLQVPRNPCEIKVGKVISVSGEDVSEAFQKGAEIVFKIAQENNIKKAILKSRSPSCGSNWIYDGTFSGKLVKGDGICSSLLKKHGIEVISEEDL
ncbi:uncharacterized protein YbbK (DUF523 family) [Breznakia sp. PF5-3]|uniref:DUF523 domain-containing protein n=1 Tax=unclassified Breznakia TaxID=2623764 RepID=UPI0024053539|nr:MULTISPECIES: DUF523 domain-containing protein [unclassified Breznakia]MDF9824794.1 uncharacterized protein YbbK (DUF523 family) [Breznakia sp. PM6-1]MDF9835750.1 uncharacterized protein YbbK (DUF523 family) [Breznakia sp. PF5-3]MDF9837836.1 uncharacterized protein YbbK (DUF523 family) [Breznakia sp. PFB2-8]MDF9859793.1 uncharacterized protein YbbK (DUF523 family) [Breznakia sp. PH5-24]